ncbi:hypothetical protein PM738_04350 [Erysipelatoclostridium ramosum]|uniref:Uncharacterized protein n=1 Tax=Thomasclavelia ramosa TaxID=1547 RepID=A0AB35IFG7_9FIRM|nr:hypothetical protein [Thomasclavelia ramosa]MDB7083024.1 hypothetical protein [Thomasclavelia ramosa]
MNRKEYEERIAKLEKELDELKKMEIEDDEFPKHGQAYWYVDADENVVYAYWGNRAVDKCRKDFLRIFKTKKECERYSEIQKAFKEESKNFELNWKDASQDKYYLCYDYDRDNIEIILAWSNRAATLYFESREILEELIARFGEEDIKKYYFGTEE